MKRLFSVITIAGVMTALVLSGGCGKEPEQVEAPAKSSTAAQPMPADHPQTAVKVGESEVLAQLPSSHPPLAGLTDKAPSSSGMAGHTVKPRNEPTVVVPDSVSARWKTVTLEVSYGGADKRELRVAPGQTVALERDGLSLGVGAFLPAYMSDFSQVTSDGDELANPAVQVSVLRNGTQVDKGWLFRDYPEFNTLNSDAVTIKLLSAHE